MDAFASSSLEDSLFILGDLVVGAYLYRIAKHRSFKDSAATIVMAMYGGAHPAPLPLCLTRPS